jgi:hypothetical protein
LTSRLNVKSSKIALLNIPKILNFGYLSGFSDSAISGDRYPLPLRKCPVRLGLLLSVAFANFTNFTI